MNHSLKQIIKMALVCYGLFLTIFPSLAVEISFGKLNTITHFESKYIEPRTVQIWLPDNYSEKKSYPVIYMHDGQMLFDAKTTWNKQEWGVDETAQLLHKENPSRNFVVVAIHNINELRWLEYFPQKAANLLTEKQIKQLKIDKSALKADNYLKFIVSELKPYIDTNYSVVANRDNTFIAGSSMGGLISMYAMLEYPDVFGGAACISTHWPGRNPEKDQPLADALLAYLASNLMPPKNHKIYFDYGDQTLDAFYPPLQKRADEIMKTKDYPPELWTTRFFKGHAHDEKSWKSRLDQPFRFLLTR